MPLVAVELLGTDAAAAAAAAAATAAGCMAVTARLKLAPPPDGSSGDFPRARSSAVLPVGRRHSLDRRLTDVTYLVIVGVRVTCVCVCVCV
jgi:hypothetical protein